MATTKKPTGNAKKGSKATEATPASPAVAAVAAVAAYTGETLTRSAELLAKARSYKDELRNRMQQAPSFAAFAAAEAGAGASGPSSTNVLGVGFGAKSTEGSGFEEGLAVRVYVRTKIPRSGLIRQELVPGEINGLPTDVVALGDLRAHARPTLCGVSVGHALVTAGTLGCLVRKKGGADPATYILSNNHVLANSNQAAVGESILEPGALDGGDPANPIANLTDFEPLHFGTANHFDAAIAQLIKIADVDPKILTIGAMVAPPMEPAIYQSVRKRGRTTLHTVGVILDLSADVRVRYGTQMADFEEVLSISGVSGPFSDGGDSGSLVVDAVTRRPVGLLFAGGNGTTFASPIQPVLDRFGIEIL